MNYKVYSRNAYLFYNLKIRLEIVRVLNKYYIGSFLYGNESGPFSSREEARNALITGNW